MIDFTDDYRKSAFIGVSEVQALVEFLTTKVNDLTHYKTIGADDVAPYSERQISALKYVANSLQRQTIHTMDIERITVMAEKAYPFPGAGDIVQDAFKEALSRKAELLGIGDGPSPV